MHFSLYPVLFHDELFYSFGDEFAVTLYLAMTERVVGRG
jgi:hypothetical protein